MRIIDKSFLKFLLVGIVNTIISFALMFLLESLGYWASTVIAYIAGAVISFFLNKKFTFKNDQKVLPSAVKFAVNVAVCYIIAYVLARPLIEWALSGIPLSAIWEERITKVSAMVFYTFINYLGQKFIAFKKISTN